MVAGHGLMMMMMMMIIIIIMVEATSIRSLPTQPSMEECTCEGAEESSYCDFAVSQGFWDLIGEDCLSDF